MRAFLYNCATAHLQAQKRARRFEMTSFVQWIKRLFSRGHENPTFFVLLEQVRGSDTWFRLGGIFPDSEKALDFLNRKVPKSVNHRVVVVQCEDTAEARKSVFSQISGVFTFVSIVNEEWTIAPDFKAKSGTFTIAPRDPL